MTNSVVWIDPAGISRLDFNWNESICTRPASKSVVPAEEGTNRLRRNILATREGQVRMPGSQIGLEPGGECGVGHLFVQLKEVRMTVANPEPENFRPPFRRKSAEPVQRKKERTEMDGAKVDAQFFLRFRIDVAEEGEREMNLLCARPANAAQMRIQPNECGGDRFRQVQTNEKPFRTHRRGLRFVVSRDRRRRRGARSSRARAGPIRAARPDFNSSPSTPTGPGRSRLTSFMNSPVRLGKSGVAGDRNPRRQTDDERRLAAAAGLHNQLRGAVASDRRERQRRRKARTR